MNNEDKRFKQINRIAKPIQVDQNGNTVTEVKQEEKVLEKPKKVRKKLKLHVNPVLVLKILIGVLIVANIYCLYLVIFPNRVKYDYKLKYNDVPKEEIDETLLTYITANLVNRDYIVVGKEYPTRYGFKIELRGKDVLINEISVAKADKVLSSVAFIDDLMIFITENEGIRSKTLYAVDKLGNKYLEIYHVSNGKVLMSGTNFIEYSLNSLTIKTSNVNGSELYLDNTIGSLNPISVCDLATLATKSIDLSSTVITHYQIDYLGNHEFSELTSVYEMNLNDYRATNNYCN